MPRSRGDVVSKSKLQVMSQYARQEVSPYSVQVCTSWLSPYSNKTCKSQLPLSYVRVVSGTQYTRGLEDQECGERQSRKLVHIFVHVHTRHTAQNTQAHTGRYARQTSPEPPQAQLLSLAVLTCSCKGHWRTSPVLSPVVQRPSLAFFFTLRCPRTEHRAWGLSSPQSWPGSDLSTRIPPASTI
jgi:hypothetical protein